LQQKRLCNLLFFFSKLFLRIALALTFLALVFYFCLVFYPDPLATGGQWDWTVRVTDRHGALLKEYFSPSLSRRDQKPLANFSPYLQSAVLSAEDKRFYRHLGVDPIAILRAAYQDIQARAIVSGGSTITMQLARLTLGLAPGPRTLRRKIKEAFLALVIERHHTKDEIFQAYLNLAPTGNLVVGFEAAARFYLGKTAALVSPAEAAFLAGLPASPSLYNPYRHPQESLARRDWVLKRMFHLEFLTDSEFSHAIQEPLRPRFTPQPFLSPHFVTYLRGLFPPSPPEVIVTTLDLELQREIEGLARETVNDYRNRGLEHVSVVVLKLPEREVLAWVGSSDFFNEKDGQLDGVLALRQPGSALKPFIFALALDKGLVSPQTLISDEPRDFVGDREVFSPRNYSGDYSRPVPVRVALASSLNIPAVNLTNILGVSEVLQKLRELGLTSLIREHDYYGLALPLGGGEVSLLSLANAYATLADGGLYKPITVLKSPTSLNLDNNETSDSTPKATRVFSPATAWIISDILADDRARAIGFGTYSILKTQYPSSVKTGTSTNFRDNWCLGYTNRFVVAVWSGNFQGQPMNDISGVTGAGRLWRQVSDLLEKKYPAFPIIRPEGVLKGEFCPISGLPAGPDCPNVIVDYYVRNFRQEKCRHREMGKYPILALGASDNFHLLTPSTGEIYAIDPGLPPDQHLLKAIIQSVPEVYQLVWLLNGQELGRTKISGATRGTFLLHLSKGNNRLEVLGLRENAPPLRTEANYSVK
jgi:penicillin-binding protein 1C